MRARASGRSVFTLVVKYAGQRCGLSPALRSIYVAALEHAYACEVEAAAIPRFVAGQGSLDKCVAAHRASKCGKDGAPHDNTGARPAQAARGKPSVHVAAIPRSGTAPLVALALRRDPSRDVHMPTQTTMPCSCATVRLSRWLTTLADAARPSGFSITVLRGPTRAV